MLKLLLQHALLFITLSLSLTIHAGDSFAQGNQSNLSNTFAASAISQPEFLSVDEAYQLNADWHQGLLYLNWEIAKGYYLYQHNLKVTVNGQTTQLELPEGETKYDDYFERNLTVYYHNLSLDIAATNNSTIEVAYQGCADAGLCYPPQSQSIQINNGVTELLAKPDPAREEISPPLQGVFSWPLLITSMIGALLGGIILNLMPCVFPVLSLKALNLTKAHQTAHQKKLHGWSYTLGCTSTFVAIAFALFSLRAAGEAIGWGFQLQSPVVVGGLAYLFFTMALLMLGTFQLSGRFSSIGQTLTEGHQYSASFFTGVLATIVASPCTAPFMGGALGYAVTLPTWIGLFVFASLGLGMALPLLLLSYFPQLSKRLPKPGAWMDQLKQFLAFPLLITAAWLNWVFGRQTGADQLSLLVVGMVAIAFTLWLTQQSFSSRITKSLRLLAILVCISATVAALTTPKTTQNTQALSADNQGWGTYSPEALQLLQAEGTPVFINLTADWCITCLANEKWVLSDEEVVQAFIQTGIVKLKGDWTNYNPQITHLLEQYGRTGVPLYLLFPAGTQQQAITLPQILQKKSLIQQLRKSSTQKP